MGISNLKSEFNQIPNLFSVLEDLRKKPFIIVSICDQAICDPHRVELQTWGTGPPNMFAAVALGRKILCARASIVDCDIETIHVLYD